MRVTDAAARAATTDRTATYGHRGRGRDREGDHTAEYHSRDAKRLLETLRNFNTPGHRPDRLGVHPWALVVVVTTVMLTVVIVLLYLLPRLFTFLGI